MILLVAQLAVEPDRTDFKRIVKALFFTLPDDFFVETEVIVRALNLYEHLGGDIQIALLPRFEDVHKQDGFILRVAVKQVLTLTDERLSFIQKRFDIAQYYPSFQSLI